MSYRFLKKEQEPTTDKAMVHAVVSGKVQGVFFRMFVIRESMELGLLGKVHNLPDGSVDVVAEGDVPKLKELMRRMHKGPPKAIVENVSEDWGKYSNLYEDFEVDYTGVMPAKPWDK
jgi:acylphosphatase